ncbi:MAG: alpha/beta hydrolase [Myxococcales bacterium]|nr:alpha/beta hydrolase [Myxococcales bacterium]MCB9626595.1 alpha/beta hydrolase [Sandaracinaceae bacterium]
MMQPAVEERRVRSFDGTDIAYHTVGQGRPVLLCNGLGGSWVAWTHQIRYLSDRYRFISWDYRGLYRSGPPATPGALQIDAHARDGLAVLDAEGVESAALLGWSMGVQVALETFNLAQERVSNMTLLNGVSGQIYESVMNLGFMDKVVPPTLRALGGAPRMVEAVVRQAVGFPGTVQLAKALGLAAPTLDEDIFRALAASFKGLDMGVYLRLLELLGEHDATPLLPRVDVPVLVVAGDRDVMTPRAAAARMAASIPGAELMVIPGATHYAAVEYPELVNLRLEKFWLERGYAAASSGLSAAAR